MQKQKTTYDFFPLIKGDAGKAGGFTLVELIVVITILAILGTIAFISLQGYSSNSRDSVRISDISSIKTGLELFNLESGKYPIPTNGVDITYSGSVVWNQGTFGKTVYVNVSKLDKIPLDPTTDKEYTYSVSSNRYEYQLGGMVEGDIIVMNNLVSQTDAGETTATAYITGNYNGLMTKSNSGTTCSVLSIPSIITNDTSVTDLQQVVTSNSFVYRGYKNLPSSFKTSKFKYNGGFSFSTNKLVAYTDTGSCTALTSNTGSTERVLLLKGLQDAYSGTTLKNEGEIKNILALSINTSSPSNEVINYAGNFVNNVLGGSILPSGSNNIIVIKGVESNPGLSCKDILDSGSSQGNGTYWVKPDSNTAFQAYCDMATDGGGWTLFTNIFGGSFTEDLLGGNLSQSFMFPFTQTNSIKGLSTDIRYNCKNSTNIIDIKTTNSTMMNRTTETGDACSQGYNWNPNPSFTTIGSNNQTITISGNGASCCCRTAHRLNTYPIGITYTQWFIMDRYYSGAGSVNPYCAGAQGAEYMRIWYR